MAEKGLRRLKQKEEVNEKKKQRPRTDRKCVREGIKEGKRTQEHSSAFKKEQ